VATQSLSHQKHPRRNLREVSTTNHGQDTAVQTRRAQGIHRRRGWRLVGEFVDIGISGTKEKRPELDRL